jgi:hypothetical protein
MGQIGLSRFEGPQTSGYGNDRGMVLGALVGGNHKTAIGLFFDLLGGFPQGKARLKGLDLHHQLIDQIPRQNFRPGGNVVYGLFGIDFGTLPTGLGQGVDQVAF